jgi:hypothetical protein
VVDWPDPASFSTLPASGHILLPGSVIVVMRAKAARKRRQSDLITRESGAFVPRLWKKQLQISGEKDQCKHE